MLKLNNNQFDFSLYDVVSFDVFDTLLFRPFVSGDDLLRYLEVKYDVAGWYRARKDAAKKLRVQNAKEDVLLAQMYALLPLKWQFMQSVEEKAELDFVTPNSEMVRAFNEAKSQKKRVIIISDMYFSKDFLVKLLAKNGVDGFDEIFVSAEEGVTKRSGKLFDVVREKLKIEPQCKWLHIGDNLHSDIAQAQNKGLDAWAYPNLMADFWKDKRFTFAYEFWKNVKKSNKKNVIARFQASYQLGVMALLYKDGFWDGLGLHQKIFSMSWAFILNFFVDFVHDVLQSKKLKNVAFVARDGYMMQKLFMAKYNVDGVFNCPYLYAPRLLVRNIDLDYGKGTRTVIGDLKSTLAFYQKNFPEIASELDFSHKSDEQLRALFDEKLPLLKKYAEKLKLIYQDYLRSLNLLGDGVTLVDTYSLRATSQRFLQEFIPSVLGLYFWCGYKDVDAVNYPNCGVSQFSVIESYVTSPENPIAAVKKNDDGSFAPVFVEGNNEDFKRNLALDNTENLLKFSLTARTELLDYKLFVLNDFLQIYHYLLLSLNKREMRELGALNRCLSVAHSADDYEDVWPIFYSKYLSVYRRKKRFVLILFGKRIKIKRWKWLPF